MARVMFDVRVGARPRSRAFLEKELERAIARGESEVDRIDTILRMGVSPNIVFPSGLMPLHLAIAADNFKAAQNLLFHGAAPLRRTAAGESAWDLAGRWHDRPGFRDLLRVHGVRGEEGPTKGPPPPRH